MPEETKDQIRDNSDVNTAGEAKTVAPVIDFDAVRRSVALHKIKRSAYRNAIRETLTVSPEVSIEIGDKTYRLEFTLKSALDFQKETGKNIAQGELSESDIQSDLSLLSKVLWYGLAEHHDKDRPTEEQLLRQMSLRRVPYYMVCLSDALEAMLPDLALVQRLEMEMKEDKEFLPFLKTSGGPGSGPSESDY